MKKFKLIIYQAMISKIEEIFNRLSDNISDPKIELHYTNDFTLLIAVILSARNTDKGVNKVTFDLFKIIQSPKELLDFGFENFVNSIRTIGLYKTKASNIFKTANILFENYDSKIPNTFEALISLPGVGRKSANVILHTLFDNPTIAVDTHVFRVSRRLGFSEGKTPHKVEEDLMRIIPEKLKPQAHHLLVLHGRYICKARKPKCFECTLKDLCPTFATLPTKMNL